MNIAENTHPIIAIAPSVNTAALAGAYISMKNTDHVTVELVIKQGNAALPVITLHQATAVAGTDVKVLAKDVNIYYVADAATSDAVVRQDDGVGFSPDALLKNKIVLLEVPAEALDMDNDFTCLQVRVGASNAANLVSATYLCSDERYHGASKIVD